MLVAAFRINTSSLGRWGRAAAIAALLPARALGADSPVPQSENRQRPRPFAGSFSFAALAGWSVGDEAGPEGYRALFGYGGRAGYSFANTPLYLGLTVVSFSDEVREAPEYGGMLYGTEYHITTDVDFGAEFLAGPLVLRPYLGLGVLTSIYDTPPDSGSGLAPRVVPGFHARYPMGFMDVGIDARYETTSPSSPSATALGSIGIRL
jgi:hypothetical protein